jgi:hypothetical protein
MSKRPSVADVINRRLNEGDGSAGVNVAAEPSPSPAPADGKPAARTRVGKKFITFPVSSKAKVQFDMLAVQMGTRREELMREALRDLFTKYRQTPID